MGITTREMALGGDPAGSGNRPGRRAPALPDRRVGRRSPYVRHAQMQRLCAVGYCPCAPAARPTAPAGRYALQPLRALLSPHRHTPECRRYSGVLAVSCAAWLSNPPRCRTEPVLATWFIRSKTSVSVMVLSLTSPAYNV